MFVKKKIHNPQILIDIPKYVSKCVCVTAVVLVMMKFWTFLCAA